MSKPVFIAVEGVDGAGKSTVVRSLASALGPGVHCTREPGGSARAERIRELILDETSADADAETLFALFWAARRDHLRETIEPTLAAGTHVITDRFDASTFAYQIYGQGQHQLTDLFDAIRAHYLTTTPTCYLVLDLAPAAAAERMQRRKHTTHFDRQHAAYHERVREGLHTFARQYSYVHMIDASQHADVVQAEAISIVREYLGAQ